MNIELAKSNLNSISNYLYLNKESDLNLELEQLIEFIKETEDYYYSSISWSILDFEGKAKELEKINKVKYDNSKFKEALFKMVNKHDAEIGITWDTVEFYLDFYCIKK